MEGILNFAVLPVYLPDTLQGHINIQIFTRAQNPLFLRIAQHWQGSAETQDTAS